MKKLYILSAVCICISMLLVMHYNTQEVIAPTIAPKPLVLVHKTNTESKPTGVHLIDVKSKFDNSDNFLINFMHHIKVNDCVNELIYVGTLYDNVSNKGHVSLVTGERYSEVWFQEDEYYYTADNDSDWHYAVNTSDLVTCKSDTSYFRKNIKTFNFVVDVLLDGKETTIVSDRESGTKYTRVTTSDVILHELIKSDTTAKLEKAVFSLVESSDKTTYNAKITVYYTESSLGIEKETFSYDVTYNTKYSAVVPLDIAEAKG